MPGASVIESRFQVPGRVGLARVDRTRQAGWPCCRNKPIPGRGPAGETAMASDLDGSGRKLLVLRISPCDLPGLLAGVVGVDLFEVDETVARDRLRDMIAAVRSGRAKPSVAPGFPGPARAVPSEPVFPGGPVFPGEPEEQALGSRQGRGFPPRHRRAPGHAAHRRAHKLALPGSQVCGCSLVCAACRS